MPRSPFNRGVKTREIASREIEKRIESYIFLIRSIKWQLEEEEEEEVRKEKVQRLKREKNAVE